MTIISINDKGEIELSKLENAISTEYNKDITLKFMHLDNLKSFIEGLRQKFKKFMGGLDGWEHRKWISWFTTVDDSVFDEAFIVVDKHHKAMIDELKEKGLFK